MANPHKGEVEAWIGAEKYLLSFSADAVSEAEIAFDTSMDGINALLTDEKKVRMSYWRTLFFHALQDHQPTIDAAAARVLFKQLDSAEAIQLVGKAWGLGLKGLSELAAKGKVESPHEAGQSESEEQTGRPSSTPGTTSEEAKTNSGG